VFLHESYRERIIQLYNQFSSCIYHSRLQGKWIGAWPIGSRRSFGSSIPFLEIISLAREREKFEYRGIKKTPTAMEAAGAQKVLDKS
jgi:hypothetical protein